MPVDADGKTWELLRRRVVSVPQPPEPFHPEVEILEAGTLLLRVGSATRSIAAFNPGHGSPSRFAFFGEPPVPVLYAAQTERAAVAETLLHDVPLTGGTLSWDAYARVVMGRLRLVRPLRSASLRGLGLHRLGVEAREVTDTPPATYERTVAWAAAAHAHGLDGVVWTARLCNASRAVALFGDGARTPSSRTSRSADTSPRAPAWTGSSTCAPRSGSTSCRHLAPDDGLRRRGCAGR